jgi:hypothetical protein
MSLSTITIGATMDVSIDVTGNGQIPSDSSDANSTAPTRISYLAAYLISQQQATNLTVVRGSDLLTGQPGSSVKQASFAVPACASPGSYAVRRASVARCPALTSARSSRSTKPPLSTAQPTSASRPSPSASRPRAPAAPRARRCSTTLSRARRRRRRRRFSRGGSMTGSRRRRPAAWRRARLVRAIRGRALRAQALQLQAAPPVRVRRGRAP